ncbi:hypothetical protein SM0020_03400 [Sinorhizobium meliloti CCNWSX0020]|uniref:Uncharacterized protein n=1 Tax=Sinorhizobium meliloti CCNWSX0020 TaxID=1107881 RepID=H0FU53_RHIML|nr:hypothetical protein SM0020_03400 [Sinorhizobium meliloti CCNWSX0020]
MPRRTVVRHQRRRPIQILVVIKVDLIASHFIKTMLDRQCIDGVKNVPVLEIGVGQGKQRGADKLLARGLGTALQDKVIKDLAGVTVRCSFNQCIVNLFVTFVSRPPP